MNIALVSIFIGTFTVTSYRSVKSQTDSSPYYTSIGERVNSHGIAISRDQLKRWGGQVDYGDLIYVDEIGFKIVNDTMNERHKKRADVWVETYKDEKMFDDKFKHKKLKIWIIRKSNEREARRSNYKEVSRTLQK